MKEIRSEPSRVVTRDAWNNFLYPLAPKDDRVVDDMYYEIGILNRGIPLFSTTPRDTFRLADEADLAFVDERNSWIKPVRGHNPIAQFQMAYAMLSICLKGRRFPSERTTYGLKHDVEAVTGHYISEGAFIRAAILAGFGVSPPDTKGSCKINLKADSVYCRLIDILATVCRTNEGLVHGINDCRTVM